MCYSRRCSYQPRFYKIRRFRLKIKARLRGLLPEKRRENGLRGLIYQDVILTALEAEETANSTQKEIHVLSNFAANLKRADNKNKAQKDLMEEMAVTRMIGFQDYYGVREYRRERSHAPATKVYEAMAEAGILGDTG